MPWTHRIASAVVDGLRLAVSVEFLGPGGASKIVPFSYSDPTDLPRLIRDQLAQLERIDAAKLPKAGDVIDLSLPVVPPRVPTAVEAATLARDQAVAALAKAQSAATDAGTPSNDAYLVKLKAAVTQASATLVAALKAADKP